MRILPLLLALGLAVAGPTLARTTPQPVATALQPLASQVEAATLATRFLSRFHYKPVPLDDELSSETFKRYLDALDPDKLFFTAADIQGFDAYRTRLDDALRKPDLAAPFAMFNLYRQRVTERVAHARSLLDKGFDFEREESYEFDREKATWAADTEAVNDLWRRRIKNDWLRLLLAGKPAAEIRQTLDKRYANYLDRVQQLNSEDVFQTFMNAYATSIEPHTNYLGPRASRNFDIAMKLSLQGIGAVLQRTEDYTAIREIVPGGPAALSGKLKVGDRIVGVGQGEEGAIIDVVGWRLDDVVEKIRGPKDTTVRLEILPADAGPDGEHVVLSLVRQKISIEEQAAKKSVLEVGDEGKRLRIGVISLPTFYQDFDARRRGVADYKSATRDVEKLLGELKAEQVDGVVVDLRNNGGGSLAEATDLTGLFIGQGPVVQVRNARGQVEEEEATRPAAWSGPLAVVVNRASASASEIFSAAIQDYGRGIIIGEPTFGKGTVQNLIDLDEVAHSSKPVLGEVKMTIAQFFRIDGGSTQLRGVTPDISFPLTAGADDFGESSYDNALPWTSIAPARYKPVAELKPILPLLAERHAARVAKSVGWQVLQEDLAEARRLRAQKSVSLNEAVRRRERDEQEARRKAREERLVAAGQDSVTAEVTESAANDEVAATPDLRLDDGLQPDERNIRKEVEREKKAKERPDVVLDEAVDVLADEITLVRADAPLAAQVLPRFEDPTLAPIAD